MKYRALGTLAWISILFVGCGDDAKPKGSVFVPENNGPNNTNSNNTNSSTIANNTNSSTNSNNSPTCEEDLCELSCAIFADPNFCWNQARRLVYECMNDRVIGTMNAAGDVCTVGDVSVEFAAAIDPSGLADIEDWDFDIVRDGQNCAEVVDTDTRLTVTTQRGVLFFQVDESEYRIECEDGSAWVTNDFEALFTCVDEDGILTLPGTTSYSAGPEFGFGLLPESGSIFQCTFE